LAIRRNALCHRRFQLSTFIVICGRSSSPRGPNADQRRDELGDRRCKPAPVDLMAGCSCLVRGGSSSRTGPGNPVRVRAQERSQNPRRDRGTAPNQERIKARRLRRVGSRRLEVRDINQLDAPSSSQRSFRLGTTRTPAPTTRGREPKANATTPPSSASSDAAATSSGECSPNTSSTTPTNCYSRLAERQEHSQAYPPTVQRRPAVEPPTSAEGPDGARATTRCWVESPGE